MLRSVRVIDASGFGSDSTVIAGVDWIAANRIGPAVVNMSIGGGYSSALQHRCLRTLSPVECSWRSQLAMMQRTLVATLPAVPMGTVTVGATERGDALASYSNRGPCVDILAPVATSCLQLTMWLRRLSGTSMASPTSRESLQS